MNKSLLTLAFAASFALTGCADFKAERLSTAEGDEKAIEAADADGTYRHWTLSGGMGTKEG